MKRLALLSLIFLPLIFTCTMPAVGNGTGAAGGRITLSSDMPGDDTGNAARSINPADAARVIISIEKADSHDVVYDSQILNLYNLGGQFISESLQLDVGDYNLTKYLIVDADNKVIFAAPVSPSELADRVLKPLPIGFTVYNNVTTSVIVEVLPTENSTAQDFGYAITGFDVVYADLVFPRETYVLTRLPGDDGIIDTDDDIITGGRLITYNNYYSDNWQRNWYDPGNDGVWNTADDLPAGWWWSGRFEHGGSYQNGPGADGIWFTSDDNVGSWNDWSDPAVEKVYNDPGADGVWFTADDVMCEYYAKEYNSNGAEIRRITYGGPGADGVWFTSDDELGFDWLGTYVVWEYEGRYNKWNSWTREIVYGGPGGDGVWFTADDEVLYFGTHEFADGTKFFTRENIYGSAGPDGMLFTDDDVLDSVKIAQNTY
jgi:hypothetical protein